MSAPREVDLLVIGAGAGGMTAALVAALEGLDVLLVEKSDQVGGTTATSAGTVWIPGNRQSIAAGFHDSAEAAATYLDGLTGTPDADGMRRAYLHTGPRVIDYLAEKTEVKFVPSGMHPDYREMPGAASTGRALAAAPFDGRLLGADFARVRPPIPEFMVFGGMMVGKADIPRLVGRFASPGNFLYAAKLFGRFLLDRLRYPRGTRLMMGNALVARLLYSLRARGVEVLYGTRPGRLLREGGKVIGAELATGENRFEVRARKGVVLATGGYGHDPLLRAQLMPQPAPAHSISAPGVAGDGINLAVSQGAVLDHERQGSGAFWAPVSLTPRADGDGGVFPHLVLDRAKPGLIAVNKAGKRFVNEACSYHDFVLAMLAQPRDIGVPAYLICDASFVAKYGLGIVHPGTRDLASWEARGYLHTGASLDALAAKLHLPAEALKQSVARHNQYARQGRDPEFGKGDHVLGRFNGDPARAPNPCLGEITGSPYVALAVWPAELGTSAGLSCDKHGRVLDAQGQPLEGLYACGNDMASIMQGTYPGPGTTLGPAMTFGYRIAMHAAGRPCAD